MTAAPNPDGARGAAPEPLPAETGGRVAEFAKACRAATRIVSMYPPTHPAIHTALARIVEAGTQVTAGGPVTMTVLPDALLVGGRGFVKPEAAVGELAALLHQQMIGELTLRDRLDAEGWHAFLTLLSTSPEDTRAAGGLAKAWRATGNPAIALTEIDYAAVLRERSGSGEGATWDRILAALADGVSGGGATGGVMQQAMALADDPAQLAQFAQTLQDAVADPAASGSGALMDLAGELRAQLTDDSIGRFLVDTIVKDHGASTRLAAAFQTLAPDPARQRAILDSAAATAAARFADDPQLERLWTSSAEMLASYSDAKFVSDGYARELARAQQGQALAVDQAGDDPPARVRAWLSTVGEDEIRALEQRLLLDLLRIEQRPDAWSGVLDTAVATIDDLVLVGDLALAAPLLEAVAVVAHDQASPFSAAAQAGVITLIDGPLVRHLALFLRQATDAEAAVAQRMCVTLGPALVKPLSDAIMGEDNARAVRRLRDILISFGPAAREYADELRHSHNPAVRRAAVDLLRALGGDAALPDLRAMLDDHDPHVQREALRAIVQVGTDDAYRLLEQALKSGAARTREAILQALGAFRDEKAARLFVHILGHTPHAGSMEATYIQTIESLGRVANDDRSVSVLRDLLHRGEWWAPGRTARIRTAAARALRGMGHPAANRALDDAAAGGSSGVRRIARTVLAEPAPMRQRRKE